MRPLFRFSCFEEFAQLETTGGRAAFPLSCSLSRQTLPPPAIGNTAWRAKDSTVCSAGFGAHEGGRKIDRGGMKSSAAGYSSADSQDVLPPLKGCDRSHRTDVRAFTNNAGEPIVVSVPEVRSRTSCTFLDEQIAASLPKLIFIYSQSRSARSNNLPQFPSS